MTHQIFDIIQSCFGSSLYWLLKHQSLEALCWPRWGSFIPSVPCIFLKVVFLCEKDLAGVLKALCCRRCRHSPDNVSFPASAGLITVAQEGKERGQSVPVHTAPSSELVLTVGFFLFLNCRRRVEPNLNTKGFDATLIYNMNMC